MITDYHALYYANELSRIAPSDGLDRIARSLFDACVDLNPHQIEAALFALQSPISKGVLLADEVGLGKTIEATILLCQFWAERRRKLMVLCPASLRQQWALEIQEKFGLPTRILDKKIHDQAIKGGEINPFDTDRFVTIMSHNFAAKMADQIFTVSIDLAVIDEAHKLRNVYKSNNVTGQKIRQALKGRRKILLTATPMQNSLMELFGLSTFIDDTLFGDSNAFRAMYSGNDNLDTLRARLSGFCKRTLRADVKEYVPYTGRLALTQEFVPSEDEHRLYLAVSEFIRDASIAIPHRQRQLTTLVLRKLLASSSKAILGTLQTIQSRLEEQRKGQKKDGALVEEIIEEEDLNSDYAEAAVEENGDQPEKLPEDADLLAEMARIGDFIALAQTITHDRKAEALLLALDKGFARMEENGAPRKALIFTESRRTQDYLKDFLESNGFMGKVVAFNGSNSDDESRNILDRWLYRNGDNGRATKSRSVDMRSAIIEHFRDDAEIMLATEAAAEGINLQFCALVINYDLPWNPQRIEQRIGRCHRYGQKHDVVVINFLNKRNEADRRVLELLTEKFKLFEGVFGASDDILGQVESGLEFEKRVLAIYQECRTEAEIDQAFQALRMEMDEIIAAREASAKLDLLTYFDEDVHRKLRLRRDGVVVQVDRTSQMVWRLTQHMLKNRAEFPPNGDLAFKLKSSPIPQAIPGTYHLVAKDRDNIPGNYLYRLSHPLAEWVMEEAKKISLPDHIPHIEFRYSGRATKISILENLRRRKGWLRLHKVTIESFEREELLVFSAIDDKQQVLDQEICEKLLLLDGIWQGQHLSPHELLGQILDETSKSAIDSAINQALARNQNIFEEERIRLEKWAEDRIYASEKELSDIKTQIKARQRDARNETNPEQCLAIEKQIRELEIQKREKRRRIFDIEDEILAKRDQMIHQLEARINQSTKTECLFTLHWSVV